MGLTMVIALFLLSLFGVIIVLGKWKIFIYFIVSLFIISLSIIKVPLHLQESTELLGEGFNQVKIGSAIDLEDTSQIKDNMIYRSLKQHLGILVRVEKEIIKELILSNEPTDVSISTMKGINLNSTFAEVVHHYGESYRKLKFVEMYGAGIEYRDKKNGISIRFFFDHEKPTSPVRNIEIAK